MASEDKGRPLPKFGEWDVNNPASAEGFTVIFNKARDEKKTNGNAASPRRNNGGYKQDASYQPPKIGSGFAVGEPIGLGAQRVVQFIYGGMVWYLRLFERPLVGSCRTHGVGNQ